MNIYIEYLGISPWQFLSTIHLSYIRITYLLLQSWIVYMGMGMGLSWAESARCSDCYVKIGHIASISLGDTLINLQPTAIFIQ